MIYYGPYYILYHIIYMVLYMKLYRYWKIVKAFPWSPTMYLVSNLISVTFLFNCTLFKSNLWNFAIDFDISSTEYQLFFIIRTWIVDRKLSIMKNHNLESNYTWILYSMRNSMYRQTNKNLLLFHRSSYNIGSAW